MSQPSPILSWTRARLPRLLAVQALAAASVLLIGCGGSTRASNAADNEQSKEQTAETKTAAFARCMREHGINAETLQGGNGRGAVTIGGPGANPESPTFQKAHAKCKKLLPNVGLPDSGSPASAQTLDKLFKISRCMRKHGISEFPNPVTTRPSNLRPGKYGQITDYDGAILLFPRTLDMQAPAYRHALTACGAPPLGLTH
jgi:hypothetical protein